MAADRTVTAGFAVWPNGPGRPPRDRRQMVNGLLYFDQDRLSLGFVARLFWAVENSV